MFSDQRCVRGEFDSKEGVIVRQRPQCDAMPIEVVAGGATSTAFISELVAQRRGGGEMPGFGDHAIFGPGPLVAAHDMAVAVDHHLIRACRDVDEPADYPRIHRIVDGVDAYVVVTGQSDPLTESDRRSDRRQRQHRQVVGFEQIDRATPDGTHRAVVAPDQPGSKLRIEVRR